MTATHTIIVQVLLWLGAAGSQLTSVVPDKWKPVVLGLVALASILQAKLAHKWNPDGTPASVAYVAKLLILFLLLAGPTMAQTPAPSPVVSVSTQALGIKLGGQSVAGVDEIGSFNLKGKWWLQGDFVQFSSACSTCAAVSGQLYLGGPKVYPSFLEKEAEAIGLKGVAPYLHGGIGVYRNAPTTGPTQQHIAGMGDAGFDYNINGTVSIGPRAGLLIAPGAGPACAAAPCPNQNPRGYFVSAELQIYVAKVLGKK